MTKKIYVGNLGYSVTNESLTDKFAEFGRVESAKIIIDRDTNRSKGFGFVEMSSQNEAAKAINAMNGAEFEGRNMNCSEAKEMEKRSRTPRW